MVFKKLFGRAEKAAKGYGLAPGKRVYAVGDIHGRLDLLNALLIKIGAEREKAPDLDHHLVLLGDYVDRGPDSAGVIDRIMGLAASEPHLTLLKGNHEDLMLRSLGGDRGNLKVWARNGGRATLLSYGMVSTDYDRADFDELQAMIATYVPPAHVAFLQSLAISRAMDGYLFVHAGIRPDVPMADQDATDMMWIRGAFLESDDDFGAIVVHGHHITDDVEIRPNRIGVDTGAYATNRLSAIVLEGNSRRVLDASF